MGAVDTKIYSGIGQRKDQPVRGAGYEPFDILISKEPIDPIDRTMIERHVCLKARRCVHVELACRVFTVRDIHHLESSNTQNTYAKRYDANGYINGRYISEKAVSRFRRSRVP